MLLDLWQAVNRCWEARPTLISSLFTPASPLHLAKSSDCPTKSTSTLPTITAPCMRIRRSFVFIRGWVHQCASQSSYTTRATSLSGLRQAPGVSFTAQTTSMLGQPRFWRRLGPPRRNWAKRTPGFGHTLRSRWRLPMQPPLWSAFQSLDAGRPYCSSSEPTSWISQKSTAAFCAWPAPTPLTVCTCRSGSRHSAKPTTPQSRPRTIPSSDHVGGSTTCAVFRLWLRLAVRKPLFGT